MEGKGSLVMQISLLPSQYNANAMCSHCHAAGCSRHLTPVTGGTPCLPFPPSLLRWASGCFQFPPPGLTIGWFSCFRCWNYSALLDPQSSGAGGQSSHREQVLCFVFLLFFIYWSYQRDPLPRPTVPMCTGFTDICTICLCPKL